MARFLEYDLADKWNIKQAPSAARSGVRTVVASGRKVILMLNVRHRKQPLQLSLMFLESPGMHRVSCNYSIGINMTATFPLI